ncbi:MAG: hypothetical protein R2697_12275 [Ilumatobacteraceae bacterium]
MNEHVQLGYAATEPGNQSDTAAGSITLATPATTCRGFYVSVTRGQGINLVCVVTDTHDIGDAVDVLEQSLASDRADHPATRTRRQLAATTPPTRAVAPRCEIPDWFERLHRDARNEYAAARAEQDDQQQRDRERQQRIDRLTEQLVDLEHHCAPHDHAIATATRDLHDAEQRHRRAEHELASTGLLHRRTARRAVAETGEAVATARTALDELTRRAQPLHDQRSDLHQQRDTLRREQRRDQQFNRSLGRHHDRLGTTRRQLDALDTWAAWAAGKNPSPAALINAASELQRTGGDHALLARPLAAWIDQHDLTPRRPAPPQRHLEPQLRPEPPGPRDRLLTMPPRRDLARNARRRLRTGRTPSTLPRSTGSGNAQSDDDVGSWSSSNAVEEAAVLLDRAGEHPEMYHRTDRLLDEVDDLANRRRQGGACDDDLPRADDRRIVCFIEERPYEPGLVLAVEVSTDVDS